MDQNLIIQNLIYIMPKIITRLDLRSLGRVMMINKYFRDLVGLSPVWRSAPIDEECEKLNWIFWSIEKYNDLDNLFLLYRLGIFSQKYSFPDQNYHGIGYKLRFIHQHWSIITVRVYPLINLNYGLWKKFFNYWSEFAFTTSYKFYILDCYYCNTKHKIELKLDMNVGKIFYVWNLKFSKILKLTTFDEKMIKSICFSRNENFYSDSKVVSGKVRKIIHQLNNFY